MPKLTPEQMLRSNDILNRAYAMLKVKEQYSDNWSDYEKIWKMVEEKRTGEDEWRAILPDTWPFATIKTAQSAFVDSKVMPIIIRHPDDPKSKAEDLQNLYTDIAEKGNLDYELYLIRLDSFKLGNGYGKTIYVKDSRFVWDIEKFDPIKNDEKSRELIKRRKILFEAGFIHKNKKCYARADILVPVNKKEWDIIEVKSATSVKEDYLEDLSFQRFCYESAGIKIRKCFLRFTIKFY